MNNLRVGKGTIVQRLSMLILVLVIFTGLGVAANGQTPSASPASPAGVKLQRYDEAIAAWNRALAGDGDEIDHGDIDKKIRSARQKLPKR